MAYFKNVITAEKANSAKPGKKIFHYSVAIAKTSPEKCVYIGDNLEKDAIGAVNAGMTGIWLNRDSAIKKHNVIEINSLSEFNLSLPLAANGQ